MKQPGTLLDTIYRLSFKKEKVPGWLSNQDMQQALKSAHRFVADEKMSRFMAELANEAFLKNKSISGKIADSLRVQSRLPYESIWIEYQLRAYQLHSCEVLGRPEINQPEAQPLKEGWLIQQHPRIDSAAILHIFTASEGHPDQFGFDTWTFPFAYAWCCDDVPLPWHTQIYMVDEKKAWPSETIVGIKDYRTKLCDIVVSPLITQPNTKYKIEHEYLLLEWTGILRRVWALLATINDLPLTYSETRTAKGFYARGQIRKGLTHKTITLNLAGKKDSRVLARQAIAHAHRRRHKVRAHWRNDWRHPPGRTCNPHLWEPVDNDADLIECTQCHGRQIYVHPHERGDDAYGHVKHHYGLTFDINS